MSATKWNKGIDETLAKCEKKPNTHFFPTIIEFSTKSEIIYLSGSDEFTVEIQHLYGKQIKIQVPGFVEIMKNTSTNYKIKLHHDYRPHLVFLLSQWAKFKKENDPQFTESFLTQYGLWCKQFGGAEPILIRDQKGIIGEVSTILDLYDKYGYDIIDSWSRDDLIDFDMSSTREIKIEAKSSSDKKNAMVSISAFNQLNNHNDSPKSILSVVQIKSSVTNNGLFIHKYLEDAISEIKTKIGTNTKLKRNLTLLEKKIEDLCPKLFDSTVKEKFFSKHEVLSIEYYEIIKDDAADKMAKQLIMPRGIEANKYKLDPTVLKPFTFS